MEQSKESLRKWRFCYSPHPPGAYTRPDGKGGRVGIGLVFTGPADQAAWNLYWLSEPLIDRFLAEPFNPGGGVSIEMLQACYVACKQELGGVSLRDLLESLPPGDFVLRLETSDYKHLLPFKRGGKKWLANVRERAKLFRGDGGVIYGNFGKRVTTPSERV